MLKLSPDSIESRKLLNYREVSLNGDLAGDFPNVLYSVLKERKLGKGHSHLTMDDVNILLDELHDANDQ